jgi:hypothetical protein
MEKDNSTFKIPSAPVPTFIRPSVYSYVPSETFEAYEELTAISEEIKQCRSKILQSH